MSKHPLEQKRAGQRRPRIFVFGLLAVLAAWQGATAMNAARQGRAPAPQAERRELARPMVPQRADVSLAAREAEIGRQSRFVRPAAKDGIHLAGDRAGSLNRARLAGAGPQVEISDGIITNAVGPITATMTDSFTDPDADNRAAPGTVINYTATIANPGSNDATGVSFSVAFDPNAPYVDNSLFTTPLAINDGPFSVLGNVSITVPAGSGVLANDADPDGAGGGSLTATAGTVTSAQSGATPNNVTINADGSFTYNPPPGFEGTDTFTYTLNDGDSNTGGHTDTATVTLSVSGMIWFINRNAGSNGDGRLSSPFQNTSNFQAVNNNTGNNPGVGDNIFCYESATNYVGAISLFNNQKLIGQDATAGLATIAGVTVPTFSASLPSMNAGAPAATLTSAGTAVQLGSGNTLRGFTVGDSATNGYDIANTSTATVGTLTVSEVSTTGTGGIFRADAGGTLNVTLASASSTNASVAGISLGGATSGTFTASAGAISGVSAADILINGGTVTFSYAGSITNTTGRSVDVSNKTTSGNVTFSGAISDTGTGINLDNNDGATILFSGGITSNTGANTAFTAINGGTVNVTGTNNIGATTPLSTVALNIANTNIGLSGVTFQKISASGGTNGIVLNNTGSSGGLTVTGDGGGSNNGSGGVIQNSTGAGIILTSTGPISLSRMNVQNGGDDGIRGSTVASFTLNRSNITSNGNAVGERGIEMTQLSGSGGISNSTISGSAEHNIVITNDTANLTAFNVTSTTIATTNFTTGDDGFQVLNTGSAAMTVSVTGSTFTDNKGDHFQAATDADATGPMNITFNSNTLTTTAGNDPNVIGGGITINTSGNTDIAFQVNSNNLQQAFDDAININLDPGSQAGASMIGTISGNTIGTSGISASGCESSNDITIAAKGQGLLDIDVLNNNIFEWGNQYGIFLQDSEGSAHMVAKVTGNTLHATQPNALLINGIRVDAGATSPDNGLLEAVLTGNDVTGEGNTANGDADIRLRQRFSTTIKLPGYGGANNDTAAVNTFVATNNDPIGATPAPTVSSAQNVAGGGGGFIGGAATPLLFAPSGELTTDDGTRYANSLTATSTEVVTNSTTNGTASAILPGTPIAVRPHEAPIPVVPVIVDDGILTQNELDGLVSAALKRWQAAGASEEQMVRLRNIDWKVADMSGWYLGGTSGNLITVDSNAGGNKWFIDATPNDDGEFKGDGTRLGALLEGRAMSRVDALTTVLHEMGHVLGLEDSYDKQVRDDLMYGYVGLAERRLPRHNQALGVVPGDKPHRAFVFTPLSIGTLPAGKSITITFQAQITSTMPLAATQVQAQGTVSGSNFANVLTDDTAVGGATDATVTLLELNQAPVNTKPGAQASAEDTVTPLVFNTANANLISISDADAGSNPVQVTVAVLNGKLTLNGTTNLSFSSGDGTSDATMTFTGAITDINTALNGMGYLPDANFSGPDTLTITTNDQGFFGGGGAQSDQDTVTINVAPTNDAPVLTVPGAQTATEDTDLAITGISVADVDAASGNLTLTLSATNGTLTLKDNVAGGLAAVDIATNGTASVTATGTLAKINATLADANGLTYKGNLNYNGGDTVTVNINDNGNTGTGGALSDQETIAITVNAAPDTPSVTNATTLEDTQSNTGLVITKNAADGAEVTHFKITSITGGTLFKHDGTTQINNNDFITVAEGADVGGFGLTFTPSSNSNTTGHFTVQASTSNGDAGLGGGTVTADITITPVNDPPSIVALGGDSVTYTEGDASVRIDNGGNAAIVDLEGGSYSGGSLTVSITAGKVAAEDELQLIDAGGSFTVAAGTVSFNGNALGTISGGGAGGGDLVFNFTTSFANANSVGRLMRVIHYANSAGDTPTAGARTVNFAVVDGQGTANGGLDSDNENATVNVVAVNDAPVVTTTAGATDYIGGNGTGTPVAIDPGVTVSDADTATLTTASIQITSNYQPAEDVLAFVNNNAATYGDIAVLSNVGGLLELYSPSTTATMAQWQNALRAVTYNNTAVTPNSATRTIGFQANDGGGAGGLSAVATKDVNVIPAIYKITGLVRTSGLVPISGVSVALTGGPAGFSIPAVQTDAGGMYSLNNVPPGYYFVTPTLANFTFSPASQGLKISNADRAANFVGTVANGRTIGGRAMDALGGAIAGVTVTIVPNGPGVPMTVSTNSAGYFTFNGVADGTYTVTPSKAGFTFAPTNKTVVLAGADSTGNNFIGASGYKIMGRITTSGGAAIANVSVALSPAPAGATTPVLTNSAGYYTIYNVPNGNYTVTPTKAGTTFAPVNRAPVVNNADVNGQNFTGS